ncbi:MAG: hypothetical protein KIT67_04235 [Alphaproteobacteria bacterium]|nr:hypothetical protein [Alphaproteobacteria bacterium]
MGMVERRAVAEFQERYYPPLLKKIHAAAGYPVPVEVKWDTLALDKESDKYNTHWPDMYFEPLVAGLGRINKDEMGRAAIKEGIKKIVIQNESNNRNPDRWAVLKDGVLTLDHLPHTNVQDRVLRGDKLGLMLEQKL